MITTMVVEVLYDSGVEKRYSIESQESKEVIEKTVEQLKEFVENYFNKKKNYNGGYLSLTPISLMIDLSKVSAVSFEIY